MKQCEDILKSLFDACKHSSSYKDQVMIEIMSKRSEFEKNLDEMWAIYSKGNPMQIVEYNKGVRQVKDAGLRVLRNSQGKHRIVFK